MQPYSHAAAPSLDRGVLSRLRRLDRDLLVTWSPYALDPLSGKPIESVPHVDPIDGWKPGGAVEDPAYYLWLLCTDGRVRLVGVYQHFGHLQCAQLEGDVARRFPSHELARRFMEAKARSQERGLVAQRDMQHQKIAANQSRINDLLNGKLSRRQAKIMSAPGLSKRSTPGEIEMDSKEAGWELPDPS